MNSIKCILALIFAFLAVCHSLPTNVESDYYGEVSDGYELPKRNFQHIWRNIQMQMPGRQSKRNEALSRARANAYYRLG